MVRYYGYYSNKTRGMRRKSGAKEEVPALMEPVLTSAAFRKNWARLIQKIYHVDPLLCPKCQGAMKIISFIEEPDIIRKILVHHNLWETCLLPTHRQARNHDPTAAKHTQIPRNHQHTPHNIKCLLTVKAFEFDSAVLLRNNQHMVKFKKLPSNILSNIPAVLELLSTDQRILFAYLFGGLAAGRVRPLSDVDIAVYLNNTGELADLS